MVYNLNSVKIYFACPPVTILSTQQMFHLLIRFFLYIFELENTDIFRGVPEPRMILVLDNYNIILNIIILF